MKKKKVTRCGFGWKEKKKECRCGTVSHTVLVLHSIASSPLSLSLKEHLRSLLFHPALELGARLFRCLQSLTSISELVAQKYRLTNAKAGPKSCSIGFVQVDRFNLD